MMHVCPGINAYNSKFDFLEKFNKKIFNIVTPAAVICAHTHKTSFKGIFNTPVISVPGLSTNSYNNPSAAILNISKEDGTVFNYRIYYSNLQKANRMKKSLLEYSHSFADSYGGSPTYENIKELAEKMKSDVVLSDVFLEEDDLYYGSN